MFKEYLAVFAAMHKHILSNRVHPHKHEGLARCGQQIEDLQVTFLELDLKRLELQFDLLDTVHRCLY